MNRDNLKHRLAEVESKIRAIAGVDIDHSDSWTSCLEKREKVGSLLDSRREIHFTLMIKLIADFGNGTVKENIECIHCSSTSLDDGQSWNEYPFSGRSEFADIIICHAVHQLTGHQLYSIPDLIRLNDFWAEAKLTIQSITRQDGTRFIPN